MYNVGLCHHHGKGVEEDQERAVEWFKKAAELGQSDAQNHLGWCYRNGSGVEWDHELAVKWLKKAAHQGDTDAHYNLGLCYSIEANKFDKEKDLVRSVECFKKAVECFRKAAVRNHAFAEYEMGFCYTSGLGVEEDYLCAANWYKRAVDHGSRDAIYSLGICYQLGRGVEKDKERALELFRVAAAQGCFFSRRRLQWEGVMMV
jgi:TPR repeat protein